MPQFLGSSVRVQQMSQTGRPHTPNVLKLDGGYPTTVILVARAHCVLSFFFFCRRKEECGKVRGMREEREGEGNGERERRDGESGREGGEKR